MSSLTTQAAPADRRPTTTLGRPWPIVYPRLNDKDAVIMGFDPGGKDRDKEGGHVGVALACRNYVETTPGGAPDTWEIHAPGWRVYDTFELTPGEFARWFAQNTTAVDCIYGEMFRLDKQRAMAQSGSTMPTSQLIGWVRYHCQLFAPHIQVHWQPNTVLTGPTASILRNLGIKPVSPKGASTAKYSTGDHQRSAELHLWHGLIRAGLVDGVDPNIG